MMTVDDLRTALADLPGDMPVIVQGDGEGNNYSPAADAEIALYAATTTWEGQRYEADEPSPATAERAVFIVPTR